MIRASNCFSDELTRAMVESMPVTSSYPGTLSCSMSRSCCVTSRSGHAYIMTIRDWLRPRELTSEYLMPSISAVMAITALMPITMPSTVNKLRPRLALSADRVSRSRSISLIARHLPSRVARLCLLVRHVRPVQHAHPTSYPRPSRTVRRVASQTPFPARL